MSNELNICLKKTKMCKSYTTAIPCKSTKSSQDHRHSIIYG